MTIKPYSKINNKVLYMDAGRIKRKKKKEKRKEKKKKKQECQTLWQYSKKKKKKFKSYLECQIAWHIGYLFGIAHPPVLRGAVRVNQRTKC